MFFSLLLRFYFLDYVEKFSFFFFLNSVLIDQVTFKEAEAAMRACQNTNPVIDGRRANCNLACLGAQKPRPPTSPRHGFLLSLSTMLWNLA